MTLNDIICQMQNELFVTQEAIEELDYNGSYSNALNIKASVLTRYIYLLQTVHETQKEKEN